MPGSYFELGLIDFTSEKTSTRFHIGDITAVSLPGALAQMGDVRTAIEAVTLGVVRTSAYGDIDTISGVAPNSPLAQRGVKWTVILQDTVTGYSSPIHIGTADLSLLSDGSDDLDISAGPGLALKNAIQTLARSRAGNPVIVTRIYYAD